MKARCYNNWTGLNDFIGPSPSGKAPGFDPGIRWFESSRPSHFDEHSATVISRLDEKGWFDKIAGSDFECAQRSPQGKIQGCIL